MCPARAPRPAWPRSTSCPRTRPRSAPRRRRSRRSGRFDHLELYPDGSATQLREAIAREIRPRSRPHHLRLRLGRAAVADHQHLCGAGRRGDLLASTASSSTASRSWPPAACPVVATETNYTADVDAILGAVTPRTKIVFLANPNNPTGTYLPFDEVKRLHAGLPPHVVLVLDAAYAEYVRRNDYESGLELVATAENVVMTRTFSKIYGLANLRLGWMVGAGPRHRCGQPHPRSLQRQRPRDGGRHRGDPGRCPCGATRSMHNEKWLAWLTRRDRGARPRGDAERRQLPPDPFPQGRRAGPPRTPMPS